MGHLHVVTDRDNYFVIDPVTRQLSNNSNKITLMKTDHNSERFTFELPLFIEDHDMSKCNKVEVHYINIDSQTRKQSAGVYMVEDFKVNPEKPETVIGSWLISRNVTMYAGTLSFVLRLACVTGEVVDYSWSSAIYNGITVSDGICNTEIVVAEYSDILHQWLSRLEHAASGSTYMITDDGVFIDLTGKLETLERDNQYFYEMETDLRNTIDQVEASTTSKINAMNPTSKIAKLETDIANLKTADTNLGKRIDNIDQSSAVTTIKSQITSLQNEDKTIKSDITNLQAAEVALGKRIDDIDKSTVISGMVTDIANLKTADTNFDSRITAIAQTNSELYNNVEILNSLISPIGSIVRTTNPSALGVNDAFESDKFLYLDKETKTKTILIYGSVAQGAFGTDIVGENVVGFGTKQENIIVKNIKKSLLGETALGVTGSITDYDQSTGIATWSLTGDVERNVTYYADIEVSYSVYSFERIA